METWNRFSPKYVLNCMELWQVFCALLKIAQASHVSLWPVRGHFLWPLNLFEQAGIINEVAFSWILTSLSAGLPHSLIGVIGLGLGPDKEEGGKGGKWARIFPCLKLDSVFSLKAATLEAKTAEDFLLQKQMLSQKRKHEFLMLQILLDHTQRSTCHSRTAAGQEELIKKDVMW